MAVKAIFHIGDQQFPILRCKYSIKKPTDYMGSPTGEFAENRIDVRLKAGGDNQVFQEWAASDGLVRSGHIFFMLSEKLSRYKTLYFINARCTSCREFPSQQDGAPPQVRLQLSAQEFTASSFGKYIDLWTRNEEKRRLN